MTREQLVQVLTTHVRSCGKPIPRLARGHIIRLYGNGSILHREAAVGTKCEGHGSLAGRGIVGGKQRWSKSQVEKRWYFSTRLGSRPAQADSYYKGVSVRNPHLIPQCHYFSLSALPRSHSVWQHAVWQHARVSSVPCGCECPRSGLPGLVASE